MWNVEWTHVLWCDAAKMLIHLWQTALTTVPQLHIPRPVQLVCESIHGRLQQTPSLHESARLAGCSTTHLTRLFRKTFGCSVGQWIHQQQAEQAKRLLCETSINISEIGLSCGFSDPSYFSRFFRKQTGYSPRAYRDRFGGA